MNQNLSNGAPEFIDKHQHRSCRIWSSPLDPSVAVSINPRFDLKTNALF
jgi:hypothetical protein